MSNEKISQMDEVTSNLITDIIPVLQVGNKRTTLDKIKTLFATYFPVLSGGRVAASQLPAATLYGGTITTETISGNTTITITLSGRTFKFIAYEIIA